MSASSSGSLVLLPEAEPVLQQEFAYLTFELLF